MKILVYGAGVQGSRYAVALHQAGHQVSVLARGERTRQIKKQGILLEAINTGEFSVTHLPVVETLQPEDAYDLVLVMVRSNRVASVLPALAANHNTPNVLFLGNNVSGAGAMTQALGQGRVLMGFAGIGGVREGALVRYMHAKSNNTYVGELDGSYTPRLGSICEAFSETRFPVKVIGQIDAWLKTHVAVISPLAYGLYMCGGDNYRMARTRDALVLTARALREGLQALKKLGYPIVPSIMEWFFNLPEPVLVFYLRLLLNTKHAEIGLAGHANAARDEMQHLADDLWKLVQSSGQPAPSQRSLYAYANPLQPPISDGSKRLAMNWSELWCRLGTLALELLLITWLVRRFSRKLKRRKEK